MLGRGVEAALNGWWERALAFDVYYWFTRADSTIVNLESPLTSRALAAGGYDLRASPESARAMQSAGIDIVTLANNHALDAGVGGLFDTRTALEAVGVEAVMAGESLVCGLGRAPQSFALIALDDSRSPLNLQEAADLVRESAAQGVPIIVSVHWGGEYQAEPSARQRVIAQVLAGAGADLIMGHGPHVLQPIESVGDTVVAYSLGNLLFDQPYPIDCRWGAVLWVLIYRCKVVSLGVIPTVTWDGRTRMAVGDEAQAIFARLGPPGSALFTPISYRPGFPCDPRR